MYYSINNNYIFHKMNKHAILFETIVKGNTKELIRASELRRKIMHGLNFKNNMYDECVEYLDLLNDFMKPNTMSKKPVLFVWNNKSSSCWQFEKLHILSLLSHWAHDKAVSLEPSEAKHYFAYSVGYEMESLKCLNNYLWKDTDIAIMPIVQDRYHIARALIYASDYYFNMYSFKECLPPIKKSFQLLEIASRIWKKMDYGNLKEREALLYRQMALKLEDDKSGEKVALLSKAKELFTNEEIVKDYEMWKQQNDSVYYQVEETSQTISLISLEDSFQCLLNIVTPN